MKTNPQTDRGAYMPTPEQIAKECRLIRSGWKDGLNHRHTRTCKIGRTAEVAYPARVEIEEDAGRDYRR